jgi:hypothetical protein
MNLFIIYLFLYFYNVIVYHFISSNKKKLSLLDYINTSREDATRYIPTELLDGRWVLV